MKYIIDVPDNTAWIQVSTDRLEPYTEPDRKAIEDEVWKVAQKVHVISEEADDVCFGDSYQEVRKQYEAWKAKRDEIHVGDEVVFGSSFNETMKAVVLDDSTYEDSDWFVLTENGCVEDHEEDMLKKTGHHFPEVAELLKKMREKNDYR